MNDVTAGYLEYLQQLGVLHRVCNQCRWHLRYHPLDYVPDPLHFSSMSVHCDGKEWHWTSQNFTVEWREQQAKGEHECKAYLSSQLESLVQQLESPSGS